MHYYIVNVDLTEIGKDMYFAELSDITEWWTEWWTDLKTCLRSVKGWLEEPDSFNRISIIDNETGVVMAQFSPLGSLTYADNDFYKTFFFEYLSQLME